MNRERKILLASIMIAVAGWLTAAALTTTLATLELRVVSAEEDSETWRRKAGKAYTELLKVRAGTDNTTVLIPAGTRIDCTMETTIVDGRAIVKCENGTIYPPRDY